MTTTREMIVNALAAHRPQLDDKQFDSLVDEIVAVREEYQAKIDALSAAPPGTLDGNVLELRQLERDETMKWVLIKQKYGV